MKASRIHAVFAACGIAALFGIGGCAVEGRSLGERFTSASTAQDEQRAKKEVSMPQCLTPIGSVAIVAPAEHNWWRSAQLQSPEALIKLYVLRSGCFTVVDRGRGFAVAEHERALATSGELQKDSNMGGGQVKVADYVITPDLVASNNHAGGTTVAAVAGSILNSIIPGVGAVAGQVQMSDKSASVTLAVTDVRTSEQILMSEGKAAKTDIGFGAGGGLFTGGGFGAAGAGSYADTALGQVIAMAYLEAYSKVVAQVQGRQSLTKK